MRTLCQKFVPELEHSRAAWAKIEDISGVAGPTGARPSLPAVARSKLVPS